MAKSKKTGKGAQPKKKSTKRRQKSDNPSGKPTSLSSRIRSAGLDSLEEPTNRR